MADNDVVSRLCRRVLQACEYGRHKVLVGRREVEPSKHAVKYLKALDPNLIPATSGAGYIHVRQVAHKLALKGACTRVVYSHVVGP